MPYGRPAIQFQSTLKVGDKFTPIKDYAPYYGRVLEVLALDRRYNNPDDCAYILRDAEGGTEFEARCWWLRKCCRRVE